MFAMPPMRRHSAALLGLFFIGCAAGATVKDSSANAGATTGVGGSTTGSQATTTATSADVTVGVGSGGGGSSGGDCSIEAGDIYVISKETDLYRFDPSALEFFKVGALTCPQGGGTATPFSMSVDRKGTAWILYNDGRLYQASTIDASCSATEFVPNQGGFKKFGMGFVANAPGSNEETLFVAKELGLGSIDTATLKVSPHGSFGFSAAAELTGTGQGDLFGFFFGFPPYIAKLDKASSALGPEQPLDSVEIGTGFAFAFWGGGFWIFTAPSGTASRVERYDPVSKEVVMKVPTVPFKIVGAGVSTCAPVENPK